MKVLFDNHTPFLLAHGGFQHQFLQTKAALEKLGVETDCVRWWEAAQRGDIIHFFGRPAGAYIELAQKKTIRVIVAELLTGLGSRSSPAIAAQTLLIRAVQSSFPHSFWAKMGWDAYTKADRMIALTTWEAELMRRVFGAPADRIAVIPNGVAEEFLATSQSPQARGKYLICTATITERKRIVETVLAAVEAQTPLWIIGRPYAETEPYAQRFFVLARQYSDLIRYEGPIEDRHLLAQAYRQARGFVLLSSEESLSLSALEAAACECPLLLSDLPWAHSVFGNDAVYCRVAETSRTARILREFYDSASNLKSPPKPLSWAQVGNCLKGLYEDLLRTSR